MTTSEKKETPVLELSNLKVGDSVKLLINNKEKMWVEITEIENSKLKGKIDSPPYVLSDVQMGDTVSFTKESVYQVLKN